MCLKLISPREHFTTEVTFVRQHTGVKGTFVNLKVGL